MRLHAFCGGKEWAGRLICLEKKSPFRVSQTEARNDSKEAAMIKRMKFASIPVRDQQRALEFYTRKLGFSVMTDQHFGPGMRWIELGISGAETGVVLFTAPGQEDRIGTFTGISLECDNVEKTYGELSGRGVEFAQPPKKESWGTSALLKDPDGNTLVLA